MACRAQSFLLGVAFSALMVSAPSFAQSNPVTPTADSLLLPQTPVDGQTPPTDMLNPPPEQKPDTMKAPPPKPTTEKLAPETADDQAAAVVTPEPAYGVTETGVYLPARPASLADRNSALSLNDGGLSGDRSLNRYRGGGVRRPNLLGIPILERSHPDYEALGIRAGSFVFHPVLSATANYSSNVFHQSKGRGDAFARLSGEIVARSTWSRHQLILDGLIDQRVFSKYSSENTTSYAASAEGRIDVSQREIITFSGEHSRDFRQRSSVLELIQTLKPVVYTENILNLGAASSRGRISGSLNIRYLDRSYQNSQLPDGTPFSQAPRDYHSWTGTGEVGYEFFSGRRAFISGSYEHRTFPNRSTPQRDVDISQILVGIQGDITPLIKGRIGLGYINADFQNPAADSKSTFNFDARIFYLFTELTTFTLTAERELTNIAVINARGAFRTKLGVNVDHEILRNLSISGSVIYQRNSYIDSALRSQGYQTLLGTQYLANRTFRFTGSVGYNKSRNNSADFPRRSDTFLASLGVSAAF